VIFTVNNQVLNKTDKNIDQTDYYLKHLITFSKSKAVKNHNDILSARGTVLVPCNTTLTPKILDRLVCLKLSMPIEFSIEIIQTINSQSLLALYDKLIINNSEFKYLNNDLEVNQLLSDACVYMEQFPILYQKLSVLQLSFPDKFMQSLLTGYFCLGLSKKLGEKKVLNIYAFVAGLIHDFSMMSLEPSLLIDDIDYSPQQFRAMQQHCIKGFRHLAMIEGFPKEISEAVLDHHENADGSGYPNGKTAINLSITSQIISIVDACIGIYQRESNIEQLGVDSLLPVLEMNTDMYIPCVHTAAVDTLSAIPCQLRRVYENKDMPAVISGLMLDNEGIQHDYCVLYALVTSIKPNPKDLGSTDQVVTNNLLKMSLRINKSLITSGLLQNEHSEWMVISCGAQQEYDYIAIEYLEVIYGEIRFQIKELVQLVSLLLMDHTVKEQSKIKFLEDGLLQIAKYHQYNEHICVEH
jgi:hypothetical protein